MNDSIIHVNSICNKLNDKLDKRLNNYHNTLNKYNQLQEKMCLNIIESKYIIQTGGVRLNSINMHKKFA